MFSVSLDIALCALAEEVVILVQTRVYVMLSSMLTSCIAAAFYDFSVTLIPYGLTPEQTTSLLAQINADVLITEAGSLEMVWVQSSSKSTADVVLVARGGSKHMDWDGGMPQVTTWDKIDGSNSASKEVPPLDKQAKPRPLSVFCSTGNGQYELVEYTSEVCLPVLYYTTGYVITHIIEPRFWHSRPLSHHRPR